ncbi:MAG TPA: hypothetical protein VIY30_06755, partial [Burkholderiaceae bacterium]
PSPPCREAGKNALAVAQALARNAVPPATLRGLPGRLGAFRRLVRRQGPRAMHRARSADASRPGKIHRFNDLPWA